MVTKKNRNKGVVWVCRNCGSYNIESLEWITGAHSFTNCIKCCEVLKFY